jgi:tetratricopeptide (TPR) repeat protein
MKEKTSFFLFFLFFFCLINSGKTNEVEEVIRLYEAGKYQKAILLGKKIQPRLTEKSEKLIVHQYLAYCYYLRGNFIKAKEEFKSLLELDPQIQLSEEVVIPEMVKMFEQVKAEVLRTEQDEKGKMKIEIPSSSFLSRPAVFVHFLPFGSNCFWQGKKKRGIFYGGLQTIFLATSLYFWQQLEKEYSPEYKGFVNYERARRYAGTMKISAFLTLGTYLTSVFDSLIQTLKK